MNRTPREGEQVKWESPDGVRKGVVEVPDPICREEFYEPEALVRFEEDDKRWIHHEELIEDG